jgi:hypothetical protein
MIIAGIDPSLTACLCAVAEFSGDPWFGSWDPYAWDVWGSKLDRPTPEMKVDRIIAIVSGVVPWMVSMGVTHAFMEAGVRAFNVQQLAGLRDCIRVECRRAGIVIRDAPLSSARKLLLGFNPPGKPKNPKPGAAPWVDPKVLVAQALTAAGIRFQGSYDLTDALCVLNWGVSELGGIALATVA